ncbi:hypothetical protein [Marinithermus hydrothermalis]|uniref:Glycoside hydrolase family 42 N-terminal domain-containing protein n=1 Tax=Marinithermus hydrothermalis (strain DSM 14884 / JCM 11576 / T1) TaxID=869210 RepID=F2NPN4_MARHT|nr:hypothetical protein [Marinithermus hydrothermalis]AEB12535.1 hypothetical protein Marky_1803 [Marinithermus hydrothermalis DSM 14884]
MRQPGARARRVRYAIGALLLALGGVLGSCSSTPPGPGEAPAPLEPPPPSETTPEEPPPETPVEVPVAGFFPLGVYDHAGVTGIEEMVPDLLGRGLDTVMFVHNTPAHAGWWDYTDAMGIRVVYGPELWDAWFSMEASPELSLEEAKRLLGPHVESVRGHPSVVGYSLADEPPLDSFTLGRDVGVEKLRLMVEAAGELDPGRVRTAVLVAPNTVNRFIRGAGLDVVTLDVYPFAEGNGPCDDTLRGFGLPEGWDFVHYVRYVLNNPGVERVPVWFILQGHSFSGPGAGRFALRVPLVEEMRMEAWLAVGEGAKGLIWFFYSPEIRGEDSVIRGLRFEGHAAQYGEVTELARRFGVLRGVLMGLEKRVVGYGEDEVVYEEWFEAVGGSRPYASTLMERDGGRVFVVVVNRDCEAREMRVLGLGGRGGMLRDVETGRVVGLGEGFVLRGGDGVLFEYLPE